MQNGKSKLKTRNPQPVTRNTKSATRINILVVRLSAIGDVVHTLPVVEMLRRHFQDCTVTWMVEEKASNLLQGYQGIDRLIVLKRVRWIKDLQGFGLFNVIREVREFVRELRSISYDIIIDFQGLLKSAIPVCLARGKRRVGCGNAREGSTFFYSEKAPPACFNDHAVKRHTGLVRYLGIKDSPILFHRLFKKEDEESVDRLLAGIKINRDKPLVLFHPSAAWSTKLWPLEKAAQLCDMLQKKLRCQIILTGSAAEKAYTGQICSVAYEGIVNVAGMTTLRELACIISQAALVVSMDSGPLHLACAVKTPVVALFGPTAPWRTGPFGDNNTVVRKEISCSPCYARKKCPEGHHQCMRDITVEEVYKVCCNYLVLPKVL